MHEISSGSVAIEDALLDLKAMIRLGLHLTEHTTEEELGRHRSELCTFMYLLLDKVAQAERANGQIELASRHMEGMMQ